MTDLMISAEGLSKRFGAVRALDKVNFQVNRGEIVGFLGPNGAGKSTTMRILTCFISPSLGQAKVHGHDVFDEPLEVRKKIGYLPQRAPLYTDMNAYEYLQFAAGVRGLDASTFKSRLRKVVEVCGLAQALGKDIQTLSHGYRQRVGLAQALIHDPPILILDEPTSDLDPNEKAEVIRYIKEIGKDRTILLSTHNLAEVEEACARAIIVSKGRVVADGPLDEIRGKSGRSRYTVVFNEKANGKSGAPPTATEVQDALAELDEAKGVRELPTDEREHKFELTSPEDTDLRPDIFSLAVDKGWTMLELRRDTQSLDAVFRELTRGDEKLDRGERWARASDDNDDDDFDDEDDEDDDQDDQDEDEGPDEPEDDEPEEDEAEEEDDDDDDDDDDDKEKD